MIDILVMRHAKSAWDTDAPSDFDRPLALRGLRDAERMAEWLSEADLVPDAILSSSAVRARSTVKPIIEMFDMGPEHVQYRDELYLADASTWIDALADLASWVPLICGHNPGLDVLVSRLSSTAPPLTVDGKLMTTAAIAHLRFDQWDAVESGAGELVDLVRPRELAG